MKSSCMALVALFAAAGLEARAQTTSEFEGIATTLANACMGAVPKDNPQLAITTCDKLIVDIDTLKAAAPSLAGHDLNVYRVVVAMAQSRVGNSMGIVDGARTARVCDRVERAWDQVSKIDAAASPSYAAVIKNLTDSSVTTTRLCRTEKGTPAGAAPLPPG
jgi:hypothetical protein